MPTLIILIGPPAVGKMTVGQHLSRLTGFQLFHLHQVTDLVTDYFAFGSPAYRRLVPALRALFFGEAARSGLDLITTGSWMFDEPAETESFRRYVDAYREGGGRVCFVELLAPLEVCLARNRTENRRRHKKTAWATDPYMRELLAAHRWESGGQLPLDAPLLRLHTEHLSAAEAAQRIASHFGLAALADRAPGERSQAF